MQSLNSTAIKKFVYLHLAQYFPNVIHLVALFFSFEQLILCLGVNRRDVVRKSLALEITLLCLGVDKLPFATWL